MITVFADLPAILPSEMLISSNEPRNPVEEFKPCRYKLGFYCRRFSHDGYLKYLSLKIFNREMCTKLVVPIVIAHAPAASALTRT